MMVVIVRGVLLDQYHIGDTRKASVLGYRDSFHPFNNIVVVVCLLLLLIYSRVIYQVPVYCYLY